MRQCFLGIVRMLQHQKKIAEQKFFQNVTDIFDNVDIENYQHPFEKVCTQLQ